MFFSQVLRLDVPHSILYSLISFMRVRMSVLCISCVLAMYCMSNYYLPTCPHLYPPSLPILTHQPPDYRGWTVCLALEPRCCLFRCISLLLVFYFFDLGIPFKSLQSLYTPYPFNPLHSNTRPSPLLTKYFVCMSPFLKYTVNYYQKNKV